MCHVNKNAQQFLDFKFAQYSDSGKTSIYEVVNVLRKPKVKVGIVKWCGAWRKYVFYPYNGTIYDATCLRLISEFCSRITREHREKSPFYPPKED